MKNILTILIIVMVLVISLVGCAATPAPTINNEFNLSTCICARCGQVGCEGHIHAEGLGNIYLCDCCLADTWQEIFDGNLTSENLVELFENSEN